MTYVTNLPPYSFYICTIEIKSNFLTMANHEIETQWMGKMQFNSLINGHTVVMDAPESSGGEDMGPIPKPFVLAALSGCTGMDIIALLRKAGTLVDELNMKITGELSKQVPMQYM